MEDISSTLWLANPAAWKTTEDSFSWNYSLVVNGNTKSIEHNNYMLVDPTKTYKLSWYLKSASSSLSMIYFWFLEYDKNWDEIYNQYVNAVSWTETYLTKAVSKTDTSIKFYCDSSIQSSWNSNTQSYRRMAFATDNSWNYSDLPNKTLTDKKWDSGSISIAWNECTFTIAWWGDANFDFPVWTKIRLHSDWSTRNYVGWTWYVPNSWTKYEGETMGIWKKLTDTSEFRAWTKFIKPFVLANWTSSSWDKMFIDDLKIEVY